MKLLTRVHGGFGSFLPGGIKIGEDAMKRLNAKPRELVVTFYQGEGTSCPCAADGVMLAVYDSPGQGRLQIASEKSPGTFAMVVIRPRKGGAGFKYTVPMLIMPKLDEINKTVQRLGRVQGGHGAAGHLFSRAGQIKLRKLSPQAVMERYCGASYHSVALNISFWRAPGSPRAKPRGR